MFALDNPRRSQARAQSKRFAISTYEHVELLEPAKEFPGRKPVPRDQWKEEVKALAATVDKRHLYLSKDPQEAYLVDDEDTTTDVGTTGRIWRTRRRRDGKVSSKRVVVLGMCFFCFHGCIRAGRMIELIYQIDVPCDRIFRQTWDHGRRQRDAASIAESP